VRFFFPPFFSISSPTAHRVPTRPFFSFPFSCHRDPSPERSAWCFFSLFLFDRPHRGRAQSVFQKHTGAPLRSCLSFPFLPLTRLGPCISTATQLIGSTSGAPDRQSTLSPPRPFFFFLPPKEKNINNLQSERDAPLHSPSFFSYPPSSVRATEREKPNFLRNRAFATLPPSSLLFSPPLPPFPPFRQKKVRV